MRFANSRRQQLVAIIEAVHAVMKPEALGVATTGGEGGPKFDDVGGWTARAQVHGKVASCAVLQDHVLFPVGRFPVGVEKPLASHLGIAFDHQLTDSWSGHGSSFPA